MKSTDLTSDNRAGLLTAEAAFTSLRERIESLPSTDLIPINIDIPHAVSIALGAAERIEDLCPELSRLPGFDTEAVRHLRCSALAALHAHLVVLRREDDGSGFRAMSREAIELRDEMRVAAEALAQHGLLCRKRLADIPRGRGFIRVARELIELSALLRDHWRQIANKTPVTRERLARAAALGARMYAAMGTRNLAPSPRGWSDQARSTRDKAFALFVRAYDECRRGIGYLRWHAGDADAYAPSLYRRRRRRRRARSAAVIASEPALDDTAPRRRSIAEVLGVDAPGHRSVAEALDTKAAGAPVAGAFDANALETSVAVLPVRSEDVA